MILIAKKSFELKNGALSLSWRRKMSTNLSTCLNSANLSSLQERSPTSSTKSGILIIGDGNFSFTKTFVCRRQTGMGLDSQRPDPNFGSRVIATEYKPECDCLPLEGAAKNIKSLKQDGVTFCFDVDATRIDRVFSGKNFSRIQWNCPDLGQGFCSGSNDLERTIHHFALSAASLQNEGGTLHLTLIAPETFPDFRIWQAFHYGIVEAMEGTGYILDSVKDSTGRYVFDKTIFYRHQKTAGDRKIVAANEGLNELIFRRTLDPNARTPSALIGRIRGFQNDFHSGNRTYGEKPYYGMKLRPGLSSDSDCEPPPNDLSIEPEVFDDNPEETLNNQGGWTWAQIAASKKAS